MAAAAWSVGVEVFTFWWGSPANLTLRSEAEVREIVAALSDWLDGPAMDLLRRHSARFEMHGRFAELCPSLVPSVARASTAAGTGPRRLVVLMGYDGRDEIRSAVTAAAQKGDASEFEQELWTRGLPPVDLLIRSGDSAHLSAGFMLWSIAEARIRMVESMWPDFTVDDLIRLIEEAAASERRYGR